MDEKAAQAMFATFLERKQAEIGEILAPIPGSAQRLSRGWAFHYQSRDYLETGDPGAMLVGHGPVVVADDRRLIEGGSLDLDPEALLER